MFFCFVKYFMYQIIPINFVLENISKNYSLIRPCKKNS